MTKYEFKCLGLSAYCWIWIWTCWPGAEYNLGNIPTPPFLPLGPGSDFIWLLVCLLFASLHPKCKRKVSKGRGRSNLILLLVMKNMLAYVNTLEDGLLPCRMVHDNRPTISKEAAHSQILLTNVFQILFLLNVTEQKWGKYFFQTGINISPWAPLHH